MRRAPQQHQLKVATMQVCTAPAIECINAGAPPLPSCMLCQARATHSQL